MFTINELRLSGMLLFVLAATLSCNSSGDETGLFTEPELYKLGEFNDGGIAVAAYSARPLSMGFHHIYFEVHEDGDLLERPEITFTPIMHMEHHSHASRTSRRQAKGIRTSACPTASASHTAPGSPIISNGTAITSIRL